MITIGFYRVNKVNGKGRVIGKGVNINRINGNDLSLLLPNFIADMRRIIRVFATL